MNYIVRVSKVMTTTLILQSVWCQYSEAQLWYNTVL